MESFEPLFNKLPKELRRFIQTDRLDSIPLASTSTSHEPTPIGTTRGGGDDLGAVIVRRKPVEKRIEGEGEGEGVERTEDRVIPGKRSPPSTPMIPIDEDIVSPPVAKKLKKENKVSLEEVGDGIDKGRGIDLVSAPEDASVGALKKSSTASSKETGELVKQKKRTKKVVGNGTEEVVVAKKRKKKPRGGGDEIDDIFG